MSTASVRSVFPRPPEYLDQRGALVIQDARGCRWSSASHIIGLRWDAIGDRIVEAWAGEEMLPLPVVASVPPGARCHGQYLVSSSVDIPIERAEAWIAAHFPAMVGLVDDLLEPSE